jgi:ribosomal protein L15
MEVSVDKKKEYDEWELGRLQRQLDEYKTLLFAKQKANKLIKKLREERKDG